MPMDIFARLSNDDEVKKVLKTTFLDEDVLGKVEDKPEKKKVRFLRCGRAVGAGSVC